MRRATRSTGINGARPTPNRRNRLRARLSGSVFARRVSFGPSAPARRSINPVVLSSSDGHAVRRACDAGRQTGRRRIDRLRPSSTRSLQVPPLSRAASDDWRLIDDYTVARFYCGDVGCSDSYVRWCVSRWIEQSAGVLEPLQCVPPWEGSDSCCRGLSSCSRFKSRWLRLLILPELDLKYSGTYKSFILSPSRLRIGDEIRVVRATFDAATAIKGIKDLKG